jgi:uncharacterized membrane protein
MAATDLPNQRTAFISGSVLAWGGALLGLYPTLSRLQAVSMPVMEGNLPGEQQTAFLEDRMYDYETVDFYVLAVVAAFGVSILLAAVSYLVALGWELREETSPKAARCLQDVREQAYASVFDLTLVALLYFALQAALYVLVFLQRWLVALSDVTAKLSLVLSYVPFVGLLLLALTALLLKSRPQADVVIGRRLWLLVPFAVSYLVIVETAHTTTLSPDRALYQRGRDRYVEVNVALGGSTSNPSFAALTLDAVDLQLKSAGEGRYFASVPLETLADGDHQLKLVYAASGRHEIAHLLNRDVKTQTRFTIVP